MTASLKGEIINLNNKNYLNFMGILIQVKYVNFCDHDNDDKNVYVKKYAFINEKQILEENIIVFYNLDLLNKFDEILSLNGFGLKTTINIFENDPYNFFSLLEDKDYDTLKNAYKLNLKQINSIIQKVTKRKGDNKINVKMIEISNALENLGYKKEIIKKCLSSYPSLLEESNFSILLKKFIEIIKSEI